MLTFREYLSEATTIKMPNYSKIGTEVETPDGGHVICVLRKDIKKGTYFTKKPIFEPKESQVLVADEYDKSAKTYGHHKFSNVNDCAEMKGTAKVYVEFTF